ncbi:MAG: hypothetical protein HDR71_20095 [Lachnospiraceae bacterium]|nr:hypothetical protein [Lachnospiraceae bacterium]
MKQKWNDFKESLTDIMEMSKKEFWLTMAVCILGGIVFGIFLSPKKSVTIASNNGNNNGNGSGSGNYVDGSEEAVEEEEIADQEETEK